MPVNTEEIKVGTRVESLNFGWMEVVFGPYPAGTQRSANKVDVRFDNTGTLRQGVLDKYFVGGYVRDGSVQIPKQIGGVYNTFTSGSAKIVDFRSTKDIVIQFLESGNICETQLDALVTGVVRDRFYDACLNIAKQELKAESRREDKLFREKRAAEKEASRVAYKNRLDEFKIKREQEAARVQARKDLIEEKKNQRLSVIDEILLVGFKDVDQEKVTNGVLNLDFKDRDGYWVLRFNMNGCFIQTRLGKLHNNLTQRGKQFGSYSKYNSCYEGVGVSELFKDPQKFCDWAVQQKGWGLGYQLDKDLLGTQERMYSEDNCVFLPREINAAISSFNKEVVNFNNDYNYFLSFAMAGREVIVPNFETRDQALDAYRKYREAYVQKLAYEYREGISGESFYALLNWKASVPQ